VDLKVGRRLGKDFTLADLRAGGFRAVFLAIGAHKGRDLRIPGVDLDGVLKGVDFLLNVNMGYRLDLGKKVIVVGGGNVALDVARAALRTAVPEETADPRLGIVTALDVARSAVRFGIKEIHLVSLESMEEMPASPEEIEQAREEGIEFHPRRGPRSILGVGGKVTGLETIGCTSVFDAQGRFNPTFAPGTEIAMAADSVILAIGQTSDLGFLRPEDGVEITPRGTIRVEATTLATTAPGIYAGGDVAFGPRIAINAIADGRRAAASIHAYLRGETVREEPIEIAIQRLPGYTRPPDFEGVARQNPPIIPIQRRIGIAEIERGFSERSARLEASRCLRCWVNTTFHEDPARGTECILCGGCADVCPEECIEFLPVGEVRAAPELREEAVAELGEAAGALFEGDDAEGTVLVKDETICIRCGLCAERCPAGTITMEEFTIVEPAHAQPSP
jgi:NADPH-dependent glutamate synthase beta subunit-like oxidoreductase